MVCVPEHVALQLRLKTESMKEVTIVDGRDMNVPYVGPLTVTFGKRFCCGGSLVIGDEVLLAQCQWKKKKRQPLVSQAESEPLGF